MQSFDHLLDFVKGVSGQIRLLRRKKAETLISPVIVFDKPFFMAVAEESVNRQKFNGRNTQPFQIAADRTMGETGKGSALGIADQRMKFGISAEILLF